MKLDTIFGGNDLLLSLIVTSVDNTATDDGDSSNELSKDSPSVLCFDAILETKTADDDLLLLSLLTPTVDNNTVDDGNTASKLSEDAINVLCSGVTLDSDLSEDIFTFLWSDDTLELTIKDDELLLSLLTLKRSEDACNEVVSKTDLSADESSTVLSSEVLLEAIIEDKDTVTPLLTPKAEDFTTDDAPSTDDLSEDS